MKLLTPAAAIRRCVSKNKTRYQTDGFDLDLSYITERIIAMGVPAQGPEAMYRNPLTEVKRFLMAHHYDQQTRTPRFRIYNLCAEYVYSIHHFAGNVVRFPFDDHQVAPLETILRLCNDCAVWLDGHPDNVVVIHCKAGKGRTGLMVCSLLMFLGIEPDYEAALALFARQRTKDRTGITIPSQHRYVKYMYSIVTQLGKQMPPPSRAELLSVSVTGMPDQLLSSYSIVIWIKLGECTPSIAVLQPRDFCESTTLAQRPVSILEPSLDGSWQSLSLTNMQLSSSTSNSRHAFRSQSIPGSLPVVQRGSGRSLRRSASTSAGRHHLKGMEFHTNSRDTSEVTSEAATASGIMKANVEQQIKGSMVPSGAMCVPCLVQQGISADQPSRQQILWDDFSPRIVLEGNIKIQLFRRHRGRQDSLTYTWFHTAFLPEDGLICLKAQDLDKPVEYGQAPLEMSIQVAARQTAPGVKPCPRVSPGGSPPASHFEALTADGNNAIPRTSVPDLNGMDEVSVSKPSRPIRTGQSLEVGQPEDCKARDNGKLSSDSWWHQLGDGKPNKNGNLAMARESRVEETLQAEASAASRLQSALWYRS